MPVTAVAGERALDRLDELAIAGADVQPALRRLAVEEAPDDAGIKRDLPSLPAEALVEHAFIGLMDAIARRGRDRRRARPIAHIDGAALVAFDRDEAILPRPVGAGFIAAAGAVDRLCPQFAHSGRLASRRIEIHRDARLRSHGVVGRWLARLGRKLGAGRPIADNPCR